MSRAKTLLVVTTFAFALGLRSGWAAQINGTPGNDQGNDALIGTSNHDEIKGFGGDDTLIGRGAKDDLFGGGNMDTLSGGDDDDNVQAGEGSDAPVQGDHGDDEVDGESGTDSVEGEAGNDTVRGGEGGFDFVDARDGSNGDRYAGGGGQGDTCAIDGFDTPIGGPGASGCEDIE
jgi:Ca2+-binding RTX toxin-like protein